MFTSPRFRQLPGTLLGARSLLLAFAAALLLGACGEKSERAPDSTHHYEARGVIRGLPPDHKTIDIEHEDIPGFMPSMTMPFEVREPKEFSGLQIGDAISFRLNVTQEDSWIDQIKRINPATLHLPTAAPAATVAAAKSSRLREGDQMPDFELIDQDGKALSLDTYRGHPLVITFIFTRCPLPNFCPRMSQNFVELQKAMKTLPNESTNARLLSISFDPKFDTPEVLKQYGEREGADSAIWKLATGAPAEIEKLTTAFSVFVQPEGGSITHSLATALVDRTGKITKIWRGNAWTPAEVIEELTSHEKSAGHFHPRDPGTDSRSSLAHVE
jgi:protein SCO1